MSNIKFACTSLANNKQGIIPVDKDGYYEMVVGGLNIFNSAGQFYVYEGAKILFEQSSQFQRRIKRGALRGEVGHPRQEKGQSFDDYVSRVLEIRESNVCVHFKEIYLDFDRMKDEQGKAVIAIMAKLSPSGPFGPMLEKSLKNKDENVCFSIRSFTKDFYNKNVYTRELKNIVTFDYVNEPGISIANKYNAPALETISENIVTETQLKRVCESKVQETVATESSRTMASELLETLGLNLPKGTYPAFTKW